MDGEIFGLWEWCESVSTIIDQSIMECYPRYWNENDITTMILRELCTTQRSIVLQSVGAAHPMFHIEWDAYKLKGKIEEECGDVGVIVRFQNNSSKLLEGVGFYEAKKIYQSGRYDGIKSWKQLELMKDKVPHHHVVLYDFEPCYWNTIRPSVIGYFPKIPINSVNCISLPTNRIFALQIKGRMIYQHCMSFATQLCLRYLQGFDLEFEPHYIDQAMGYIDGIGGASFLIVANVAVDDGSSPPPEYLMEYRRNVLELYEPLLKRGEEKYFEA